MYQLKSFWQEHTPQYKKETKKIEKNIVETNRDLAEKDKRLRETERDYVKKW